MAGDHASLLWFLRLLDITPYKGTYDLPFVALSVFVAVLSQIISDVGYTFLNPRIRFS